MCFARVLEREKDKARERDCVCLYVSNVKIAYLLSCIFEPRCEKTGLRGLRQGPTKIGLHSHRR